MDLYGATTTGQLFAGVSANGQNKLWTDSEITGKCVSPLLSFSREKRFKWSSIYWPEDNDQIFALKRKKKSEVYETAQKISKLIDEEEKNEARIKQIKRTFSSGKSNSNRKDSGVALSTKKPFKLSKDNEKIVLRLAQLEEKKQSRLRDRHGNRCNMFQDPEMLYSSREDPKFIGHSTGFKTSRKIKLQLPHNYFPGPGSYQIKRYLQQLDIKSQRQIRKIQEQRTDTE